VRPGMAWWALGRVGGPWIGLVAPRWAWWPLGWHGPMGEIGGIWVSVAPGMAWWALGRLGGLWDDLVVPGMAWWPNKLLIVYTCRHFSRHFSRMLNLWVRIFEG
jgi:hypothetical protein